MSRGNFKFITKCLIMRIFCSCIKLKLSSHIKTWPQPIARFKVTFFSKGIIDVYVTASVCTNRKFVLSPIFDFLKTYRAYHCPKASFNSAIESFFILSKADDILATRFVSSLCIISLMMVGTICQDKPY